MFEEIKQVLNFISSNSKLIVTSTIVVCEVAVTVVNYARKMKEKRQNRNATINAFDNNENQSRIISFAKDFLWCANPINLFKSP